jgi:predicted RNA-binding protein with PIN domain
LPSSSGSFAEKAAAAAHKRHQKRCGMVSINNGQRGQTWRMFGRTCWWISAAQLSGNIGSGVVGGLVRGARLVVNVRACWWW